MNKPDGAPYYVWRRSDGYVGCTRYEPRQPGFTSLLVTHDWPEAYEMIEAERAKS